VRYRQGNAGVSKDAYAREKCVKFLMRKTLFLAFLFPFAFWSTGVDQAQETTQGSNAPAIIQKPLKGELAPIKLALNQPLKVWQKLLGDGNNIENEDGVDNIITYRFNAGRFTVTVEFTGTSRLLTWTAAAKVGSHQ
jgi:hypothetical protein